MECPPALGARGPAAGALDQPAVGERIAEANVLHSGPPHAPVHGEIE
jgi:hypothetical protein